MAVNGSGSAMPSSWSKPPRIQPAGRSPSSKRSRRSTRHSTVHKNEDELFYVLEGEHVFQCGEDEFHVGPGGIVFAPRGVPHAHRRVVPRNGRFLTLVSPAGFEGFFRELAEAERAGSPMESAYARVSEKYAVTWLNN
jgi:hypothetical protein